MATHDYVINNQTSADLRIDLNNALAAIVSQNSGATAPASTFANQFWYDTSTDQLKQRNEANTVWITLGTTDQTNNKFEPNQTFATQAEAQAGTNNTKAMTALRTAEAITALTPPAGGTTLLGTLATTSGSTVTLSSLTLTDYKYLYVVANLTTSTGGTNFRFDGTKILQNSSTSLDVYLTGHLFINLINGQYIPYFHRGSVEPVSQGGGNQFGTSTYRTTTTSVSFNLSVGTFSTGAIYVYGVK